VKIPGGDVDVASGSGFRSGDIVPLVRLTVTPSDGREPITIFMRPLEARMVGLDLIGAGHAAMADNVLRVIAKQHGLDGDGMIGLLHGVTEEELGPG